METGAKGTEGGRRGTGEGGGKGIGEERGNWGVEKGRGGGGKEGEPSQALRLRLWGGEEWKG